MKSGRGIRADQARKKRSMKTDVGAYIEHHVLGRDLNRDVPHKAELVHDERSQSDGRP
jgi:hypothetical protein